MSTATEIANHSCPIDDLSRSPIDSLGKYHSRYNTELSSCSSPSDSSSSLLMDSSNAQASASSNHSKEATAKIPYPILSDHRDPTLILTLLQKETQTTSKKILEVTQLVETYEKKLSSNHVPDKDRKSLKFECIRRKQQLDALKKHERRVNLQIDYITMKTEIRCLEDKRLLINDDNNSTEKKQIETLERKLKQKLEQMKIYMRKRNEEMKKLLNEKQKSSSSSDGNRRQSTSDQKTQQQTTSSDLNRKRSLPVTKASHSNKHFKSTTSNHSKQAIVRLASRLSNHQTKSQPMQTPTVRFLKKTTDSTINNGNSVSPTTPASSSSTLSPPLIATTSTGDDATNTSKSLQRNTNHSVEDDGEPDLEFDVDELFIDDSHLADSDK
ncbi:hypothetical protein I4U23_025935 [Adineta vaga]|nr:hypothetical protein I4U23_025935 [Adineta vaga]